MLITEYDCVGVAYGRKITVRSTKSTPVALLALPCQRLTVVYARTTTHVYVFECVSALCIIIVVRVGDDI